MASVQYAAQHQLNATSSASSSSLLAATSAWDARTAAGSALALVVTLLVLEQVRPPDPLCARLETGSLEWAGSLMAPA